MNRFENKIDIRSTESWKWNEFSSDVRPMWIADMDFMSPPAIIEHLQKRVEVGVLGYATPKPLHFEIITEMLENKFQFKVNKEWIVFCPSLVSAVRAIGRMSALEPESEIIVPSPCYPPFTKCTEAMGASVHISPMKNINQRFEIDYESLNTRFEDEKDKSTHTKTKYLILCNPHNPTGQVMSLDELNRLGEWVKDQKTKNNEIVVVSDEIHCEIIMDSTLRHIPYAAVSHDFAANSITLMSPSKTYNTPGISIGFAIIPDSALRSKFSKVLNLIADHPSPLGLTCLEPCYRLSDQWRGEMLEYLRSNLELLKKTLAPYSEVVKFIPPQATYLAWLDFTQSGVKNPSHKILQHAKLALSNGVDFEAEYQTRLNFACQRDALDDGLNRLCEYLDTI